MARVPPAAASARIASPAPPLAGAEPTSDPDKVKSALQECRLLVLGVQILLGFASRSFFAETYEALTGIQKWLLAANLVCLLASFSLLMTPAMYHRIAHDGSDDPRVFTFANRMSAAALLPFAAAIGLALFVLVGHAVSDTAGIAFGAAFASLAVVLWYAIEIALRKPKSWMRMMESRRPKPDEPSLKQRIEQLMTETRIILPGVQALLGFNLSAILTQSFDRLPETTKLVHVTALAALGIAMILLMAPAAYHRIVTAGEATEDVLRFSHYALLAAMVPLAFGLAAGLYVTLTRAAEAPLWPAVAAFISVALMLAMWFAVPLMARRRPAQKSG